MSCNRKTKEILNCALVVTIVLFVSIKDARADFVFGEPENLGPAVNSPDLEGFFDISSDGLELYFGSDRPGGQGDDIWVTKRENVIDPWELSFNPGTPVNGPYSEGAPCITPDGLSLYFGSNRPGGLGNWDIYVTKRATIEDPWEEPVNLGASVNSASDESSPSISADGLSLYFQSSRPGGLGGIDIYVTTRELISDPWVPAVNLGSTVNNTGIDLCPRISNDGLLLYFSRFPSGMAYPPELWLTRRRSISDFWSSPVNIGLAAASPKFSADESIIFFSSHGYGGYGGPDFFQVSIEPVVDLNSDGIVDCADMCIMVDNWGTDEPLCDIGPTPFGDGIVDVEDLIVLAEHLFEEFPQVEPVE